MQIRALYEHDKNILIYFLYRASLKRIVIPIVALYMLANGLSVSQIALITAISSVVSFFLEIPSGALADTIGHKRSLIISSLLQAISMALFFGGSYGWILAGTTLYFGAGTLMTGTYQAILYEYLLEQNRADTYQKIMGRTYGINGAIGILFMLLAGATYAISPYLPFVLGVAQFALNALLISFFPAPTPLSSVQKNEGKATFFSLLGTAWQQISQDKRLLYLLLASGVIFGSLFGLTDIEQVLLEDTGLAAALFGLVWAGSRAITMVISPFVYRFTHTLSESAVFATALALLLLFFVLPLVVSPWFVIAAIYCGTIITALHRVASSDYVNRLVSTQGSRSTVLSMGNAIENLAKVGAATLFALFALVTSSQQAFILLGGIVLFFGAIFTYAMHKAYARPIPSL